MLGCIFIYHVHAVPSEARRGCQITWNWSYMQLLVMWVLGTKAGSFVILKVLLTAEVSFQTLFPLFKSCIDFFNIGFINLYIHRYMYTYMDTPIYTYIKIYMYVHNINSI